MTITLEALCHECGTRGGVDKPGFPVHSDKPFHFIDDNTLICKTCQAGVVMKTMQTCNWCAGFCKTTHGDWCPRCDGEGVMKLSDIEYGDGFKLFDRVEFDFNEDVGRRVRAFRQG